MIFIVRSGETAGEVLRDPWRKFLTVSAFPALPTRMRTLWSFRMGTSTKRKVVDVAKIARARLPATIVKTA